MFGLIRFVFSLLVLAIVVWFATNVQLGSRTLWGHLRAIGSTREAKELAAGTEAEAKKVAERLLHPTDAGTPRDMARPAPRARRPGADRPLDDEVGDDDRRALDKLVKKKTHAP